MRCLDCKWLAGSSRIPQDMFADRQGYCDHPDREGGPWNVLQLITRETRCERLERADQARIDQREKALKILEERKCGTKSRDSRGIWYRTTGR